MIGPSDASLPNSTQEEPKRLSALVKRCRARIPPDSASLGPYLRLPVHVGQAVSQEEVAEAVGITRHWYSMMERGRGERFSSAVLGRIADALMMDPTERAALFHLAVPEIRSTSLTDRSTAMLEAFGSLRRLTQRLWAASTEAEALMVVREHAMTLLAPNLMVTYGRVADQWDRATTGAREEGDRDTEFVVRAQERCGPAAIDHLLCYEFMTRPGELMTRAERDGHFPDVAAKVQPALDAVGWTDLSFAMTNVQSQGGFVARILAIHNAAHAFSEVERAQLSTLAEVTSLALSGCLSSALRAPNGSGRRIACVPPAK